MNKILLITRPIAPPWDEASKNFAYHLAKNASGFDFSVLTPGKVPELEENINQIPLYTKNHLDWSQRLRLLKLAPLIRNFDVAHFMLTPNKINAFAFKWLLHGQKIKTVQTIATLREDLFLDKEFKKIIFADLVITYSDYAKNKLEKLDITNVMRIYPGIDLNAYKPKQKDRQALLQFGISNDEFVIMYPGEYTRLGATDDIVSALPSLFEKIPNAKFVFANRVKNEKDAHKKAEVVSTLTKQGVINRVIFTDTFSDMPTLFNLSDVVIFPVRNMEGKFDVPLAVIEAMSCAKPVIISNLPILQEFTSKNNSLIVEPGNPAQLVDTIVELFNNKDKCEAIGASARLYVEINFDINSVAKQYEQAYKGLLL